MEKQLRGVHWIHFPSHRDERGTLTAVEANQDIPIPLERVFFVHDTVADRGGHAHRETDQVVTAVHGKLSIDVSDGEITNTYELDDITRGLYIPRMLFVRLYDFSPGAVCGVFASNHYDASNSIRSWEDYLKITGNTHDNSPRYCPAEDQGQAQFLQHTAAWLESRTETAGISVTQVPLSGLDHWRLDQHHNFVHTTGRFFSIRGLSVRTNFGSVSDWDQPIIIQPEVGILGIISRVMNGVRFFLMQAKMEPGNINLVQLSPTVQATVSNYTQIHGGKIPPYLDYFLTPGRAAVLVDQLQSEQGSRFLYKQNRNMIVEVNDDIPLLDNFRWFSLDQIGCLLETNNAINMDARSVLGCIGGMNRNDDTNSTVNPGHSANTWAGRIVRSAHTPVGAVNSTEQLIHWFCQVRSLYRLESDVIPLSRLDQWVMSDWEIAHVTGQHFDVIGVSVSTHNREIQRWDQPILRETNPGLVGFLVKDFNTVLHFLVQAKIEPGSWNVVELAPTVSCSNLIHRRASSQPPPFLNFFLDPEPDTVLLSTLQSEEGGRFYHWQNNNMIVELASSTEVALPVNYTWMTLHQIHELMRRRYFNVEARCLLAWCGLIAAGGAKR